MIEGDLQALSTMPELELHDLLAQLARSFRAQEISLSASRVVKCKAQLSESEISALDRFFSLFLSYTKQVGVPSSWLTRSRILCCSRWIESTEPDD
jgi:hypothetical protein